MDTKPDIGRAFMDMSPGHVLVVDGGADTLHGDLQEIRPLISQGRTVSDVGADAWRRVGCHGHSANQCLRPSPVI